MPPAWQRLGPGSGREQTKSVCSFPASLCSLPDNASQRPSRRSGSSTPSLQAAGRVSRTTTDDLCSTPTVIAFQALLAPQSRYKVSGKFDHIILRTGDTKWVLSILRVHFPNVSKSDACKRTLDHNSSQSIPTPSTPLPCWSSTEPWRSSLGANRVVQEQDVGLRTATLDTSQPLPFLCW